VEADVNASTSAFEAVAWLATAYPRTVWLAPVAGEASRTSNRRSARSHAPVRGTSVPFEKLK